MTKDEASALFERVHTALSGLPHPYTISLVYHQAPGIGKQAWSVVIGQWNSNLEYHFADERGWQDYKIQHSVLETDQDLEDYADAMRTQAEIELEQVKT